LHAVWYEAEQDENYEFRQKRGAVKKHETICRQCQKPKTNDFQFHAQGCLCLVFRCNSNKRNKQVKDD
jgi:hypothetical protein